MASPSPWDVVDDPTTSMGDGNGGLSHRFNDGGDDIDLITQSLEAELSSPSPSSPSQRPPSSSTTTTTTGEHSIPMGSLASGAMLSVAEQIFESQADQVKSIFNVYATIDLVRPYFDVEPMDVATKLAYSLYPRVGNASTEHNPDLYGPLMLVLTLAAILLLGMQNSGTTVQQGTLIGTSFALCFTYWFLASAMYWFGAFLCSWNVSMAKAASLVGYSLSGYCLALFSNAFAVPSSFSWMVLVVFGGLSASTLGLGLFGNIPNKRNAAMAALAMGGVHFIFLVYLHLAYVRIYEEVNQAL